MKVFYYCNFPAPYYIGFLNELGKLCELTVVFERGSSSERDTSWKQFCAPNIKKMIILHGLHTKADMAFCPQIIRYVKKEQYDAYIIHDPASPTGMWLIWYMKIKKMRFVLQSEGGFPGDGRTGLKEKYKHLLMKGATLYISSMSIEREYFLQYGARPENSVRYPFTSFYEKDIARDIISQDEKEAIRKKLGVNEKKVIISVGSIIRRKGHDILLKSCSDLDSSVGLYIVGGQPNKELLEIAANIQFKNVHFIDFVPKNELWNYYRMADFFVLATREDTWGLFVNEAMANGLPVITTNRTVAGLELIEDWKNGFLVDVEDVESLRQRIKYLLSNDEIVKDMGKNNLKKIRNYTFENEAKATYSALLDLNKERK